MTVGSGTVQTPTRAEILGRIDRFPRWGLNAASIVTIGLGMLFVQYDIFNINVSFAQTCLQIIEACVDSSPDLFIGLPILVSLLGYGVGALTLGPLSDRFGRHSMLIVSMAITGLGSFYSMMSADEFHFAMSRFVTGIGVGADLAIINVFINEISPRRLRGKYTSSLFIMAAIGSALGVWLGLLLTTPATPWPNGLPVALATETFDQGWRWVYGVGAVLAIFSLLLRMALPESPRWLADRGRLEEAKRIVDAMEKRATRKEPLLPAEPEKTVEPINNQGFWASVRELFTSPRYLRRLIILSIVWLLAYVTIYGFSGAFTSVLIRQGFSTSEAGMISAIGLIGFILAALVARQLLDRVERKLWALIGTVITIAGAVVVIAGTGSALVIYLGAVILFFGQNLWVPAQYALTAESFPTRSRTTAYALADSIGHAGAGFGVFLLVPLISDWPLWATMFALIAFLFVAAIINLFAPATRNKSLEEISA